MADVLYDHIYLTPGATHQSEAYRCIITTENIGEKSIEELLKVLIRLTLYRARDNDSVYDNLIAGLGLCTGEPDFDAWEEVSPGFKAIYEHILNRTTNTLSCNAPQNNIHSVSDMPQNTVTTFDMNLDNLSQPKERIRCEGCEG